MQSPTYVLPSECQLLDRYFHLPGQDPEWIPFVRERLETSPPAEFETRFRSLFHIELCSSTLDMILDLYKVIFLGREDPLVFIPINDLDRCLRSALESCEFDQTALSEI